jgi:hypothetical protein
MSFKEKREFLKMEGRRGHSCVVAARVLHYKNAKQTGWTPRKSNARFAVSREMPTPSQPELASRGTLTFDRTPRFHSMMPPMSFTKTLPIIALASALVLGGCSSLDHHDRSLLQEHGVGVGSPLYEKMQHGEPLNLPEIIELSQRGLPPRFIVEYVHDTHFVYHLKPEDLRELRSAGVSREIVDYLQATPGMYAPRIGPYPDGPYPYGGYPYGPYGPGPYPDGPYGYGVYGSPYYHRYHYW